MVFSGRRMPAAVLMIALLAVVSCLFIPASTSAGKSDWTPVLPDDFESEYPTMITIEGGAVGGTGYVVDLIWNQTAGPIALNMTEDGMKLNFTPSEPGDYTFEMRIVDDKGNESGVAIVNITVVPNHSPVIMPHNSTYTIDEDSELILDISEWVEDDDEELDFSINSSDADVQVNPLGFGAFQLLPAEDLAGDLHVSFLVMDEFNNSILLETTIIVLPIPDAPEFKTINGNEVLVGTQAMSGYEDAVVLFNFTIDDPDLEWGGDTLTLESDQGRILINGSSGWFIPDQDDVDNGSMIINFQVTDSYGLQDNVSIILDIINVNDDPVLVVNGMMDTVFIMTDMRINFTGSYDVDGDTLTFFVKEGTGAWIQAQGFHVLNFDTVGDHSVEFKVEDGNGGSQNVKFTVKVVEELPVDDDDNDVEPPDDDDDTSASKRSIWKDPILIVLLVTIAILAVIFLVLLVLMIKNRKKDEEDPWESMGFEE
jgi:hypothetical protein